MTSRLNEATLAHHLQPIRGMALSHAIYASFQIGLLDALSQGSRKCADLAVDLDLDADRLDGLSDFLENEGYVERDGPFISLTDLGVELTLVRPWYELLVGGYAGTLGELPAVMKSNAGYANRRGAAVAVGSCGISQHDALPMVLELMSCVPTPSAIVDLGCGDGTFLAGIALRYPAVPCIGVEPDAGAHEAAEFVADRTQLQNLRIVTGNAIRFEQANGTTQPGTCYLTAFVLQEILEQSGEDAVVELLRRTFKRDPSASWIVIEVDLQHPLSDRDSQLALGYYNPYFLIHRITEQRLVPVGEWRRIFAVAGVDVVGEVFPDPDYDSLGLKVGFALRAKGCG